MFIENNFSKYKNKIGGDCKRPNWLRARQGDNLTWIHSCHAMPLWPNLAWPDLVGQPSTTGQSQPLWDSDQGAIRL